jgi:hypothetical protein
MRTMRNSTLRVGETTPDEQLKILKAMYMVIYNSPEDLIPYALELFHTIGAILEGTPLQQLELHRIDKQRVLGAYNEFFN